MSQEFGMEHFSSRHVDVLRLTRRRKLFTKRVKARLPWLKHVADDPALLEILPRDSGRISIRTRKGTLCLSCRGARLLCGKGRCPLLIRASNLRRTVQMIRGEDLEGTSPPGVFVGRFGYPKVNLGPLIPPERGDTSLFDRPESWLGLPVDRIVSFRVSLVRASFRADVRRPWETGKLYEGTLEAAMSSKPVDAEARLSSPPRASLLLDAEVQPMGPLAPVEDLRAVPASWDPRLERAYYDTDLRASEAVQELYEGGVDVSKIQRAFSVGAFGISSLRRLVPTRWSITAVDDIISARLRERAKTYDWISEHRVYSFEALGNRWVILMSPGVWTYESIEAWYPGTTWNPTEDVAFVGDWEGPLGRTRYASMGGCYYAARLAVAEALERERRQARVLIQREIHRDQLMPLGVWLVRESVRAALRRRPVKFDTVEEALEEASRHLSLPLSFWVRVSETLGAGRQETLSRYL